MSTTRPPGQEPGFFGSLFDLSFTSFVTTKIVKVLYVIAMVIIGLYALAFVVFGFTNGGVEGVLALIGAAVFSLFGLIYARVLLEFVVVVFRIGEHTATMARSLSAGTPPSAPQVPWSPPTPSPTTPSPTTPAPTTPPPTTPSPTGPPGTAPPAPGWGPPPEPHAADDPTRRTADDPTRPLGEDRDDRPHGRGEVPPPPA